MLKYWHKILLPVVALALLALALGACAQATPVPPTNTPVPPAPTAVPPSPTTAPKATEAPTAAPKAQAVTARQVQQLLMGAFNKENRKLALWNIQPGLGTVMIEYGYRIALTDLAVQKGDWGMAQYQLKEATEIQEVGEVTRPKNADLLKNFEHAYLDKLAADIQAKDQDAFNADFVKTVDGCNACHKATGHPYVRFQPPKASPMDILALSPSEPKAPGEPQAQPTITPAADKPLTWPELVKMVDAAFNTPDRRLALWNIQPGLGTVMIEYGSRFALTKFAADAGDWGMAQYQLKEATEIQEVGEVTRPKNADLLKNFEHKFLDPLAKDIQAKDQAAFDKDFETAMQGCNACHQATGHPYVDIQDPQTMPFGYLLTLGSSEPKPPAEGSTATATAPSYPSTPPTLADAQKLITQKMNQADRSLALWNIQPGLGTVMREYGYRFALAWFAAKAQDWGMAQYQIKEATEIQEVGEVTRPKNADLLKNFEHAYLDKLMTDIQNQDLDAFQADYQNAVQGCNACHNATSHAYVEVNVPTAPPVDYLQLAATNASQSSESQESTSGKFDAATAFATYCSVCHGEKGAGGVANPNSEDGVIPALNTKDFAEEFDTAAKIKEVLLNGSMPEKAANATGDPIAMPSYKDQFSSAELDALVAYIQSLSK